MVTPIIPEKGKPLPIPKSFEVFQKTAAQDRPISEVFQKLAEVVSAISGNKAGPAGDLQEFTHGEDAHLLSVKLAQLAEEHGANRNVDADAQGIGPTDHLEQALLRGALYQKSVFGQETGVMNPNAVAQESLHVLAIG